MLGSAHSAAIQHAGRVRGEVGNPGKVGCCCPDNPVLSESVGCLEGKLRCDFPAPSQVPGGVGWDPRKVLVHQLITQGLWVSDEGLAGSDGTGPAEQTSRV